MKLFDDIPIERPATPLLDTLEAPAALRAMNAGQLAQVADELRAYLLYSVGVSGGHFGAGLGVVELTVALHQALETPHDRLVWDVGHQAYPHKILTGRREAMTGIRQYGGLAAFRGAPSRSSTPSASATPAPRSRRRWAWRWPPGPAASRAGSAR